ncbi:MAG: MBL fold metallo-hydrolase [Methanobacterium sp.]|jgi:7,8-dihydropterin-6-yl-methyl-4-(beta-D-ribofuranosyl)aminobenzene 5'-phosphate synthase
MNLQILYDNIAGNGFKEGWGFSCFIKTSKENILFDTGWDGNILLHNMKTAGINPEIIDKVVISHSDWDHIGGLNHILKYGNKPEVYVPESISINLKNEIKRYTEVVEISKSRKICENVWTTGELGEKIKEQSLIIKTEKGNVILTGCTHPGLESITEKSRGFGEIYTVIGGFHDSDIDILGEIPMVVPCHCTEKIEEIKKTMTESYKECFTGFSIYFI